jgi:hypothetical protein
MKPLLSIITAAAAAIAALIRLSLGDDGFHWVDPDAASVPPPITPKLIERYAQAGVPDQVIADRFLVDVSLIQTEYADVLRSARAMRDIALRGCQLELARKLNGPMLVWLGKNELGQSNSRDDEEMKLPEIEGN